MQTITCSETVSGVTLTHKPTPAALTAFFYIAVIAFGSIVVWNIWPEISNGRGSWLPPFDQLPAWAKTSIIYTCLGISLLICLVPLQRAIRILMWGETWEFDALQHILRKNGKQVCTFEDITVLRVHGDFRSDEVPTVYLYVVTTQKRKIQISQDHLHKARLEDYMRAARLISQRTRIPYEKTDTPPSLSIGWNHPEWWETPDING